MALKASTKPKVKINWIKAISGNNIRCQLIPSPPNTQNIRTIIQLIKKFTKPLIATDIGRISLGKYTFFNIFAFAITTAAPCVIPVVKKVQGIKAVIKNIV